MRVTSLLIGAAVMAFAGSASALPLAPISYSPDFQTSLEDDYGVREGEVLNTYVAHAIDDALARRGASLSQGNVVVEVSIVDADPNRPTMKQLFDQPSLDAANSVSIGGAELQAVLRGSDGRVLEEVNHRRYSYSLEDVSGADTTWSDARRAIRQFANKVADAYVAQSR